MQKIPNGKYTAEFKMERNIIKKQRTSQWIHSEERDDQKNESTVSGSCSLQAI
jgi:hypothetical protein